MSLPPHLSLSAGQFVRCL